jgi:hypothetical protein
MVDIAGIAYLKLQGPFPRDARALRVILFIQKPWNSLDLLREANEARRPVSKLGGPNIS